MRTTCLLLALVPSLAVLRAAERADTKAAMMPRTEDYTLLWRAEGPPYFLGRNTRPATETLCFHGCTFVHVPPKTKQDFIFQMVYARYGGVFAASHAQLCLIGWGHNQFWDEATIGDAGGMREEWTPKRALDVYDRRSVALTGPQPWLSIHGLDRKALQAGDAAASRGLVVRAWRAVLGGKPAPQPQASFLSIMAWKERT